MKKVRIRRRPPPGQPKLLFEASETTSKTVKASMAAELEAAKELLPRRFKGLVKESTLGFVVIDKQTGRRSDVPFWTGPYMIQMLRDLFGDTRDQGEVTWLSISGK